VSQNTPLQESKGATGQLQPSRQTFTAWCKNPPDINTYKNHHEHLTTYRTEKYKCTYLSVIGLLHWGSLLRELLTRVATGCHVSTLAGWITDRAAFGGTRSLSNQSCGIPKCKSTKQHTTAILLLTNHKSVYSITFFWQVLTHSHCTVIIFGLLHMSC
jgi:hypothetical protein